MYLNNGVINQEYIKTHFKSSKQFLRYLLSSRGIAADVVINNKIITSSIITFTLNSGYVIASVDSRFAFAKSVDFSEINIICRDIKSGETVVTSYTSEIAGKIPMDDVDADLNFKVGELYPHNELKDVVPVSRFNSMHSEKMPKIDWDSLPDVVTPDDGDNKSYQFVTKPFTVLV